MCARLVTTPANAQRLTGRTTLTLPLESVDKKSLPALADLSGGERNRVHLAKLLLAGGNLLLLDEPTNDLDVETLRALEEALLDFPGCAMVISHDRWFLDRIATHILAFEDSGEIVFREGNYQDYEADFRKRRGGEPGVNRRAQHRKLA